MREVSALATPVQEAALDWFLLARDHRWSDDDLEPVLTFLRDHPAHLARIFRWPPSVRRERHQDGPSVRVTLPAARVELIERDRIVVRDGHGSVRHFGCSLPAWARCALGRDWPAAAITVLARGYRPWETVRVSRAALVFVPPSEGGEPPRTIAREDLEPGWLPSDAPDPAEVFAPYTAASVEPLRYPPELATLYDTWTREDVQGTRDPKRDAARALGVDVGDDWIDHVPAPSPTEEPPVLTVTDSDAPQAIAPVTTPATIDLVAYTDGSGPGAGGDTGVGVVVFERVRAVDQEDTWRTVCEVSRFTGQGTNNTAELSAIWHALYVAPPGPLTIVTDSEYARGVLLHPEWRLKANQDLVTRIRGALARRDQQAPVTVEHVRGHEDCPEEHRPGNWRADYLAGYAVDRERNRQGRATRTRKLVTLTPDGHLEATPERVARKLSEPPCAIESQIMASRLHVGHTSDGPVTPALSTAPSVAHPAPLSPAASGRVAVSDSCLDLSSDPNLDPGSDLCILDTETTGFRAPPGFRDRLVEIAVIRVRLADLDALAPDADPRAVIRDQFVRLVDPECSIPASASDVHGLRDEDVRYAPTVRAVLPELVAFLGRAPILAHNARYDRRVLLQEFLRAGLPGPGLPFYCSLEAAQSLWPKGTRTRDHALGTLAAHFQVNTTPTHRALADVTATAGVLAALRRLARDAGRDDRLPALCRWKGARV